jgi:hypothetical protein
VLKLYGDGEPELHERVLQPCPDAA